MCEAKNGRKIVVNWPQTIAERLREAATILLVRIVVKECASRKASLEIERAASRKIAEVLQWIDDK